MIDIEKIKAAAMAATQGEWETQDIDSGAPYVFADQNKGFNNPTICNFYNDVTPEDSVTCGAWYEKEENANANANYVAKASPQAVLELITRLEAAEKDAARYRWLRDVENQLLEDDPCVSDDCFTTYYDSELDDTIDRLIKRNAAMKESA